MRYVILFFLLIEAFFGHGRPATAYDLTPVIREELAVLPLEPVEDYLIRLDQDVQRLLPRWDPMAWAQNGVGFNPADGLKYLLSIGFKEVVLNFRLLIQIIALAGVCSVLHRLHTAWLSENVTDLAYAMTYLVFIGLAVGSFVTTLQLAREARIRLDPFSCRTGDLFTADGGRVLVPLRCCIHGLRSYVDYPCHQRLSASPDLYWWCHWFGRPFS